MKIFLRKVEVKGIDGNSQKIDFDYKGLANYIFNQTKDIGELELARELYKEGELEINKETAIALKRYIGEAFSAVVQESLFPRLDAIIN